jgi:phosphoribosyl-ATP pyrophosphohydrolase/phosphoribosyl-AMP cyclohydrolase
MSPIKRKMTDRSLRNPEKLDGLAFWENGLLPVVAQSVDTGDVLMVAFANREALEKTLETGQMHYWSRSRGELWHKGATSGNFQDLVSLHADCDGDTLLARVRTRGPACHTGESTCFGTLTGDPPVGDGVSPGSSPDGGGGGAVDFPEATPPDYTLPELWDTLLSRATARPAGSYTVKLLDDENLRLKKLGEETVELVTALARGQRERAAAEGADLVYHLLTALLGAGVTFQELLTELEKRKG